MFVRDLKSRRFSNYFLTLYDMKYIDPFTQFIKKITVKELKQKVKDRLELVLEQLNHATEKRLKKNAKTKKDEEFVSDAESDLSMKLNNHLLGNQVKETHDLVVMQSPRHDG